MTLTEEVEGRAREAVFSRSSPAGSDQLIRVLGCEILGTHFDFDLYANISRLPSE